MYQLENFYGKRAWDVWKQKKPLDLRDFREPEPPTEKIICDTYDELVTICAFLAVMNKRLTLMFRGQKRDEEPLPRLFRDSWRFMGSEQQFVIPPANQKRYFDELESIGRVVYEICAGEPFGLPRWRGLREIREIQWAVIQHYELWPTPLIDITTSLRVACTFALNGSATGYLYVAAMPNPSGSITFDIDNHVALARLHSCCPPLARRPHLQDGFLVGRFPFKGPHDPDSRNKSNLKFRTIAKIELRDNGNFWSNIHRPYPMEALLPTDDSLSAAFGNCFGRGGQYDLIRRARELEIA